MPLIYDPETDEVYDDAVAQDALPELPQREIVVKRPKKQRQLPMVTVDGKKRRMTKAEFDTVNKMSQVGGAIQQVDRASLGPQIRELTREFPLPPGVDIPGFQARAKKGKPKFAFERDAAAVMPETELRAAQEAPWQQAPVDTFEAPGPPALERPSRGMDIVARVAQPIGTMVPQAAEGIAEFMDLLGNIGQSEAEAKATAITPSVKKITRPVESFVRGVLPTDPTRDDDFVSEVAGAFGSAGGFAAGGLGAKALRIPSLVSTALLGAGVSVSETLREADRMGIAPDRRNAALLLAAGAGLTEMVGLGRALNKFGLNRQFIQRLFEIAEEGGQEAVQTWLGNLNAAYVGAYDPNRPLSQDVAKSALLGAIVGGGFQAASVGFEKVGQALDRRQERRQLFGQVGATQLPPLPTRESTVLRAKLSPNEQAELASTKLSAWFNKSIDEIKTTMNLTSPSDIINLADSILPAGWDQKVKPNLTTFLMDTPQVETVNEAMMVLTGAFQTDATGIEEKWGYTTPADYITLANSVLDGAFGEGTKEFAIKAWNSIPQPNQGVTFDDIGGPDDFMDLDFIDDFKLADEKPKPLMKDVVGFDAPFDMDIEYVSATDLQQTLNAIESANLLPLTNWIESGMGVGTNQDIYNVLLSWFGDNTNDVNAALQNAGYTGIVNVGGMGGIDFAAKPPPPEYDTSVANLISKYFDGLVPIDAKQLEQYAINLQKGAEAGGFAVTPTEQMLLDSYFQGTTIPEIDSSKTSKNDNDLYNIYSILKQTTKSIPGGVYTASEMIPFAQQAILHKQAGNDTLWDWQVDILRDFVKNYSPQQDLDLLAPETDYSSAKYDTLLGDIVYELSGKMPNSGVELAQNIVDLLKSQLAADLDVRTINRLTNYLRNYAKIRPVYEPSGSEESKSKAASIREFLPRRETLKGLFSQFFGGKVDKAQREQLSYDWANEVGDRLRGAVLGARRKAFSEINTKTADRIEQFKAKGVPADIAIQVVVNRAVRQIPYGAGSSTVLSKTFPEYDITTDGPFEKRFITIIERNSGEVIYEGGPINLSEAPDENYFGNFPKEALYKLAVDAYGRHPYDSLDKDSLTWQNRKDYLEWRDVWEMAIDRRAYDAAQFVTDTQIAAADRVFAKQQRSVTRKVEKMRIQFLKQLPKAEVQQGLPAKITKAPQGLVMHNISSSKLDMLLSAAQESLDVAGQPMPSIAIVHPESVFNSFGDITLIGTPDMLRPAETKTHTDIFPTDFYTPTVSAALGEVVVYGTPLTPDLYQKIVDAMKKQSADAINERISKPEEVFSNAALFNSYSKAGGSYPTFEEVKKGLASLKRGAETSSAIPEFEGTRAAQADMRYARDEFREILKNKVTESDPSATYTQGQRPRQQAMREIDQLLLGALARETFPTKASLINSAHNVLIANIADRNIYDNAEVANSLERYIEAALRAFQIFRDSPLIYMEAQPQRVVGLGEYVAALVPTADTKATKRLEELGLRVYNYASNSEKVSIQKSLAQFRDLTVDPDSGYGALYNKIFETPEDRQQRSRVESATMKRWGVPAWSPFSAEPAANQVHNARFEFRKYKRTGRIYTNNIGLMLLGLVDSIGSKTAPVGTMATTVESEGALGGLAFQYQDVTRALRVLNDLNDTSVPTDVINSLKEVLQDALQGMRETGTWSVTASTVEPSAITNLRQTLRHEGIHQIQYKIDETLKNIVDYDWFASTELGQKAIAGLAHYKVPDDMSYVYPIEAMAHLGAGQHFQLGLTAEEGAQLLADMFDNVAKKHGIELLRKLPLSPAVKERIDDIARTAEQNAEGYEYIIRPAGRNRGILERLGQWFRPKRGGEADISTTLRNFENIDASTRPPGKFEQLQNTLKSNGLPFEFTWLDKLKRLGVDEAHPVLKAWHFLKSGFEAPSENAEYLLRLWLGTSGKVDRVFSEGMVDAQNRPITPGGLDWLLGTWEGMPRTTAESEMTATISMMVAERTLELATKQWANPGSGRAIDDVITGVADPATLQVAGGDHFLADVTASISELKRLQAMDPTALARVEEAASRYRQWARALLDYAHDKGRMSDARYNEMVSNGNFYVDLHRILDDDPDAILDSTPTKYGKVKRIMQKLTGSEKKISNPYLNLMIQTEQVIKETDRNSAMNAFVEPLRTAQSNPQMQALYDSLGERIPRATRESVRVFNNGTEEHWDFHPEIEAALKGYGDIPSNMITNVIGFPFKVLRTMITHTPGFLVRNFLRDAQQRTLLSRVNETARAILNPLEGSKPWDAITTLFKPLSKADRNSFWLTGASQAGYYASSRIDWQSRLNDAMNDVRSDKRLLLVYPKALFRLLAKDVPVGLENVNRQAEFKAAKDAALKQGMTQYDAEIEAAFQSRDLMDFAVTGTAIKQLNKFVLFLNPAIQGLKRTQKAIREKPLPFMFRWAIYALMPALGELWWNYGQGDDEFKEWQQLPAWRKDLFYNLKIGDDKWITIPKPFELGVAASLTNRLIDYSMLGNKNAFEDSGKSIWKSLIPVDDWSKLIGPFISVAEANANWSYFYDEHIIPPGEEKRDVDYAKRRGSFIGQQLSKLFDQDPRIIDYYLRANLSDWATIANYTGELFNSELTPKEKEANAKKLLTLMTGNIVRPTKPDQAVNVKAVMKAANETFGERTDWYEPLRDAINDYRDQTDAGKREQATRQALAYADRVRMFVPKLKSDLDGSMGKLNKLEETNAVYKKLDKRTKDVVDSKLRSDLRAFDHELMSARVKGDRIAEAEALINKRSFNLSLALLEEILNYKLEQQEKGIERKVSPPMPRR